MVKIIRRPMHGSRKFLQMGSNFFLVDEGREDPNTTVSRPFKWCFAGGLMVAQH